MTITNTSTGGVSLVRVREPAQLIASLPAILGFRPADSLVLLGLAGPGARQVGPVVRADLPPPELEAEACDRVKTIFAGHPVEAVAAVVVGRHQGQPPPPKDPPHGDFIELLESEFTDMGAEWAHGLWTPEIRPGKPWMCYEDPECRGILPDGSTTTAAVAATIAGAVTFDSREELERLLAPEDPVSVERRAALMSEAIAAVDPAEDPAVAIHRHTAEVRAALAEVKRSEPVGAKLCFPDDQIVRLALALSHTPVRDACLGLAVSPSESVRQEAERLWLELVRQAPAPERTEPAALLAFSAYMRGEGALAGIALENALDANAKNMLATLLEKCLQHGFPPQKLRSLAETAHIDDLCRPTGTGERGDAR